jgi:hypothetical protein
MPFKHCTRSTSIVMVVLGTTIHEFAYHRADLLHENSWMARPSLAMTVV